jgi:Set1/Ash2 histone methyltransferase complex subunit ASH2
MSAQPEAAAAAAAAAAPAPAAAGGAEADTKATRRAAGGGKKRGGNRVARGDEVEARPEDFVRIVPYKKPAADKEGWRPVGVSRTDKAQQLALGDDRLGVTGSKGYRTARATHGAHEGTWYCEVAVTHLGETGECLSAWVLPVVFTLSL